MEIIILLTIGGIIAATAKGIYDSAPPPPATPPALPPGQPLGQAQYQAALDGPAIAQRLEEGGYLHPQELAKLVLYQQEIIKLMEKSGPIPPHPPAWAYQPPAPSGFPTPSPAGFTIPSPPVSPQFPQAFPQPSSPPLPQASPPQPPPPGTLRVPQSLTTAAAAPDPGPDSEDDYEGADELVDALLLERPDATDTLILHEVFGLQRQNHKSGHPASKWQKALAIIRQVRENHAKAKNWPGLRIVG